jgi:CheY-like chemotaxis protein
MINIERFINALYCHKSMVDQDMTLDVLVVDDESSVRGVTARVIFMIPGAKADQASGGQEGIDKYVARYEAGNPYNLVVTDLNMPGKNGNDVTNAVKQLHPKTKVIMMSGYENTQDYASLRTQVEGAQPDGFLNKPFMPIQLKNKINEVM